MANYSSTFVGVRQQVPHVSSWTRHGQSRGVVTMADDPGNPTSLTCRELAEIGKLEHVGIPKNTNSPPSLAKACLPYMCCVGRVLLLGLGPNSGARRRRASSSRTGLRGTAAAARRRRGWHPDNLAFGAPLALGGCCWKHPEWPSIPRWGSLVMRPPWVRNPWG